MRTVRFLLLATFLILSPVLAGADELTGLVEAMARVGYASDPTFSSDGSQLAFLSNLSGMPQVWTVPVEGGYPRLVTALDDPVTGVSWSPTDDRLAISVAPGGGLNSQIYLVRPDGTELSRISDGGRTNNWLSGWSRDGGHVLVASSRRTPAAMDAYFVSPEGEQRLVAENQGIGSFTDTSSDGSRALLQRMVSRGSNDLYLVDVASTAETLLTPHGGPAQFQGVLSPDGATIYLSTNLTTDRRALGRVRVTERGPGDIELLLARGDAELEGLAIDEEGSTLALFWNVGGRSELSLYAIASGEERAVGSVGGEILFGGTFSRDGRLLAVTSGGAARPFDLWIVDTATGGARQITHSPHPGVRLGDLVQPDLATFTAHDGLELSGWLYRARGTTGPGPVVVNFHGGPEGQSRPNFNSTFQALLARGISVFDPNVRGSSGFGKRFVNLDNGALRFDAVRDIESVVRFLVDQRIADPRRIGIMGGSYGGYMVMAGLADYPELFAAGANLFGVVNFETFFANTEPWMAAISTVEYGDPETEAELLRQLSPIHRVDRVRAPTIVLHGANDTNVPVVEAEQVVASLEQRGVPVEYILFPDEGHGWRKTANRVSSTVAIVDWFGRYLLSEATATGSDR